MALSEVVRETLRNEAQVCDLAIRNLETETSALEQRHGMTTDEFKQKFDAGKLGDDADYFVWYGLAEALAEWQNRKSALMRP